MKKLLLALIVASFGFGQAVVLPVPKAQFFDNNGQPLAGGLVYSYISGTTTPTPTYIDAGGTTANSNPVVLDSTGRANIWLLTTLSYKIVVQSSTGQQIYTVDGITGAGGGSSSGQWTTSGSNIYNANTGRVGIGCSTPVALLDICGSSSGQNYLLRIDDAANSPGINLYGIGNSKLGSIAADSTAAFRVRAGNDATQILVTQGSVLFQDQTSTTGTTTVNIQEGAGQGTNNLLQLKTSTGTSLGFVDAAGEFAFPLYNATNTGLNFTFQNSNSKFLVDGNGDLTASGAMHIVGNVQFDGNLNITGTCTGCGGGGGGGGLPVSDNMTVLQGATDHTKTGLFNVSTNVPPSTAVTLTFPSTSITVVGEENAETISGAKTFTSTQTLAKEFVGTTTGSGFVFSNSNGSFIVDGNGNVNANATSGGGNVLAQGFVVTDTFLGMKVTASTPGTVPGSGYSGLTYKGGVSGLHVWLYDTVHSVWSDLDLGSVAGGLTSINGLTGPALTLAASNGLVIGNAGTTITLGPPQPIGTGDTPTFTGAHAVGAPFNATATGTNFGFILANNNFLVNGQGDVTFNDRLFGSTGFLLIDASHNAFFQNVTIGGTCTGCASGSVSSITGTANQVIASAAIGAVTLSLPQSIATTSTPTFGAVVANGAFNSTVSGSTIGFLLSSNKFLVDGNGNITGSGTINIVGNYAQGGVTFRNTFGDETIRNLTITGSCSGCSGGVPSVTGTANQVLVNGTTGLPQGGAVTLSLPQNISTSSNPVFATVTTGFGGAFNSQAGSGQTAFLTSNNNFIVDGTGNISAHAVLNLTGGGGSSYNMNGTTVIDGSRNLTNISAITASGAIVTSGNVQALDFVAQGGFFGTSTTISVGGCNIFVQAGIIYAKSGAC